MDWAGWAVFGLAATTALTGIMVAAQLGGLSRMDIPLILGTLFTDRPDRARFVGFLVHLVIGQLFAIVYAGAFALLGESTWWLGALFGLFHGLAALVLFVPLAAGVHPRVASDRSGPSLGAFLEPPGLLSLNYGRETPIVTLVAHVTYGAILGTFLSP
ncbi:MAG: hypothetical protein WD670_02015 [Actinomycetota bacterium]